MASGRDIACRMYDFQRGLAFAQRALKPAIEIVKPAKHVILQLLNDHEKRRRLGHIHDGIRSR